MSYIAGVAVYYFRGYYARVHKMPAEFFPSSVYLFMHIATLLQENRFTSYTFTHIQRIFNSYPDSPLGSEFLIVKNAHFYKLGSRFQNQQLNFSVMTV